MCGHVPTHAPWLRATAVIMASQWASLTDSFDECRLSIRWLPNLKPRNWPGLRICCQTATTHSHQRYLLLLPDWKLIFILSSHAAWRPRHCSMVGSPCLRLYVTVAAVPMVTFEPAISHAAARHVITNHSDLI